MAQKLLSLRLTCSRVLRGPRTSILTKRCATVPKQGPIISLGRVGGTAGLVAAGAAVVVAGCTTLVSAADTTPHHTLLVQADQLYDNMKYQDIYTLLYDHRTSNNADILWRLGRATYERAKAAETDADKKALYREALDYVEAGLAIDPDNFAVHKWMSILIDYVYGYEGTKARISQSYNVKEHMLKACELNPKDGTSRHLLGYWYFSIASIPWYQRNIAAVIFATPPSGTYQEALDQFLMAEQLEPNFYSKNLLMIGKCFLQLGKKAEAREYLQRTAQYPIKTQDDRESVEEANTLLNKL